MLWWLPNALTQVDAFSLSRCVPPPVPARDLGVIVALGFLGQELKADLRLREAERLEFLLNKVDFA